jgi:hypothetical protein
LKWNLMQILHSLKSAISLDYNHCRMHLAQIHINISCKKLQHSVPETLITPLYNKLAKQLHYIQLVLHVARPDSFGLHFIFVISKLGNKFCLPVCLPALVSLQFSLATNCYKLRVICK